MVTRRPILTAAEVVGRRKDLGLAALPAAELARRMEARGVTDSAFRLTKADEHGGTTRQWIRRAESALKLIELWGSA